MKSYKNFAVAAIICLANAQQTQLKIRFVNWAAKQHKSFRNQVEFEYRFSIW